MYALTVQVNDGKVTTCGSQDLCVLSAILTLSGKLGPEAFPRRDDGTVDIGLRLGGLTARQDGVVDVHLEWLRADLQPGDIVTIQVAETESADSVIDGHEAEQVADDERAYFEHCKQTYFELRGKYESGA